MMEGAFFSRRGDQWIPSEHTIGPWSAEHQHAGPPAALLARAFEAALAGYQLVRVTYELLRPVPLTPLAIQLDAGAGRRVRRLEARMSSEGVECVVARALAIRRAEVPSRAATPLPEPAMPGPESCEPVVFPFFKTTVGYQRAMELRIGRGGIGHGHAAAWLRMRVPLVEGEAPSPLQRLMCAADSGSGVSTAVDHTRFVFINPDLTVHVHRLPVGEWIGLDARSFVTDTGFGVADDRLHDANGPVGRAVQSLFVDRG